MKFQKGNSGKPAGATNKTTGVLRDKLNTWLVDNFETLEADIKRMKGKARVEAYIKLLSFGLPTLKAVEHSAEIKYKMEAMTDEQLEELVNQILNEKDETAS